MKQKSIKRNFKDVEGQVFNKLTIIKEHERVLNQFTVICLCECGKEKVVVYNKLISNLTKTCGSKGCKSGRDRIVNMQLYRVWDGMKQRCINTKNVHYKHYGRRGVKVCNEWINNYKSFYDWAYANGYKKGLQLDKDISGGMIYSPSTCKWVTPTENNRHTRSTKLNEIKVRDILSSELSRKELSKIYNVSDRTIGKIKRKEIWKDI